MSVRDGLRPGVRERREWMVRAARRLIAIPSPNPPLDTRAVAAEAAALIGEAAPAAAVEVIELQEGVTNLVAVLRGRGPGRRVVFSGHLDTYPLLEHLPWTVEPLGGRERDGRIHGRGACDMKGGIAATMAAFAALAGLRDHWAGEVVLALAGDEESMGALGTRWLLDHRPEVRGDATLIADVGSPEVLRFGEKGFLWFEVEAAGKPAHGAHVHLGVNAAERLMGALAAVTGLRGLPVATPPAIAEAISRAAPVSERLAGAGESDVLRSVTVNIGQVEAGTSPNLVPASARARGDIRLPVGVSCAGAEVALRRALDGLPGIAWRVLRRAEPSFTDPGHEVVRAVARAAAEVRGAPPAVNMRVGGSDARLFRADGLPTVVYGPTPFGMGGADESVLVDDLATVAEAHALAAWDLLQTS
jgi:acetylornithine deacetylase/succinyl-diaminopimelate desuccinylase-like protein